LEASRTCALGRGAHVEVGLTEGRRLSFKQSDIRSPSTLKKDMTKMVNGTSDAMEVKHVTKEK
jgi:hypothetical protein